MPGHAYQGTIPADHPVLQGHFPGAPVVPGVVILDRVEQAIRDWLPAARIARIVECKFLTPLRPEQTFGVELTRNGDWVRFECRTAQALFASGVIQLGGGT